MTFRTPRGATADIRRAVGRAIACVAEAYLGVLPGIRPNSVALSLNRGASVPLRADTPLRLFVEVRYTAVQVDRRWAPRITAYYYALEDERYEILAYHWHPEQTPNVTFPHLHLEAGSGVRRQELTRAHLPTGHVPLPAFLRMAITDFGVEPRREDWQDVLARTATTLTPMRGDEP